MQSLAASCLATDLVIFTISGFLPGEYVLRTFPLLCKFTQFSRYSLSLLGPQARRHRQVSSRVENPQIIVEREDDIYGVYLIWRDLQRVLMLGHSINALKVEKEELLTHDTIFPHLELFYIQNYTLFSRLITLDRFPRLTRVEIAKLRVAVPVLLQGLWHVPLVSLIVKEGDDRDDGKIAEQCGPPAFAQTLRSLHVHAGDDNALDLLLPFCQNLQDIGAKDYHEIMDNNPNLTGLSLFQTDPQLPPINLTQHTQLVKLAITDGRRFFSKGTHSRLDHVSLHRANVMNTRKFLTPQTCPAVQHVTLMMAWRQMIQIIMHLDPNKCKLLTLDLCKSRKLPPLDEVRAVLDRGFRVNEQFVLSTRHATHNWDMIKKLIPDMKNWKILHGEWLGYGSKLDRLVGIPQYFFPSFPSLSVLHLNSSGKLRWTKRILHSIMTCCPLLKRLHVVGMFKGALQLESQSLSHLNMEWKNGFSMQGINLELPNLIHFSFLVFTLGKVPLNQLFAFIQLQMPRLRYLRIIPTNEFHLDDSDISKSSESNEEHERKNQTKDSGADPDTTVSVSLAHLSLVHLIIQGDCEIEIDTITLQNLPNLRQVIIDGLSHNVQVMLEVPAICDLSFRCWPGSSSPPYIRHGNSDRSSIFKATLCQSDRIGVTLEEKNEITAKTTKRRKMNFKE